MTIKVKLTKGKVALIDKEDFEKVSKHSWYAHRGGNGNFYPATRIKVGKGCYKLFLLHRFLLNPVKGMEVDHRNCNGLDNRRKNLRICTRNENARNTRIRKDNKSGVKGVCFINRKNLKKRWVAQIQLPGRKIKVKYCLTKMEAAAAYKEFACKNFGEFARC